MSEPVLVQQTEDLVSSNWEAISVHYDFTRRKRKMSQQLFPIWKTLKSVSMILPVERGNIHQIFCESLKFISHQGKDTDFNCRIKTILFSSCCPHDNIFGQFHQKNSNMAIIRLPISDFRYQTSSVSHYEIAQWFPPIEM